MSYTSLHNHSDFSNIRMLDSTNKVEKLIDRAVSLRLNGIAITDHESLSGHIKAIKHLKSLREKAAARVEITPPDQEELYATAVAARDYINNFKLILGNEIYLVRNKLDKNNYVKGEDRYHHFILLAKDEIGHEQLRQLSSRAWPRSYYQFIIERVPTYYSDLEEIIGANPGHIIGSTACLGGFLSSKILEMGANSAATEEIYKEITQHLDWCKSIFGDDFFLEIQPSFSVEQVYVNKHIVDIGRHQNIRVIATTDSHYLSKDDRLVHKAYLNAGEGDREVDAFYATTYLMSVEEMFEYFKENISDEVFNQVLHNTNVINEMCEDYNLFHNPIVPTITPDYNILTLSPAELGECVDMIDEEKYPYTYKFAHSEYEQDRFLYARIMDGLSRKFPYATITKEQFERIEVELLELWNISEKMGERLSAYLLTVSKIVDLIWTDGDSLVGPSRGSALGFFINYLLDITQISPLDKNFELPHWRSNH